MSGQNSLIRRHKDQEVGQKTSQSTSESQSTGKANLNQQEAAGQQYKRAGKSSRKAKRIQRAIQHQ